MNNIAWSVTLLFKAYEGLCSVGNETGHSWGLFHHNKRPLKVLETQTHLKDRRRRAIHTSEMTHLSEKG